MRRLVLAAGLVALLSATEAAAGQPPPVPDEASRAWMRQVLETWVNVARVHLRIDPQPLPWLIFYDEQRAWHVNAEVTRLPAGRAATAAAVPFGGRDYVVHVVPHAPGVWLPAGDPLTLEAGQTPRIFSMPYGDEGRAFVVMPFPSLIRRLPDADTLADPDGFFAAVAVHEIVHTRHLGDVMRRITALRERHPIPAGITDNVIQETFGHAAGYAATYAKERDAFFQAAGDLETRPEASRRAIREALALAEQRRATFFTGDRAVFADLDDIFLVMEGVAVWAQLQALRAQAPRDETWQATAMALLSRNTDWVQEEGLVLFVLIDRFVPDWQSRFLTAGFPSPFAALRGAMP